jgi:hypothetical protein
LVCNSEFDCVVIHKTRKLRTTHNNTVSCDSQPRGIDSME